MACDVGETAATKNYIYYSLYIKTCRPMAKWQVHFIPGDRTSTSIPLLAGINGDRGKK